jgi:hypothetical protein
MLVMLFAFGRNVADPLFQLDSGNEISGDTHFITIEDSASSVILASGDRQDGAEPIRSLSIPWRPSCRL